MPQTWDEYFTEPAKAEPGTSTAGSGRSWDEYFTEPAAPPKEYPGQTVGPARYFGLANAAINKGLMTGTGQILGAAGLVEDWLTKNWANPIAEKYGIGSVDTSGKTLFPKPEEYVEAGRKAGLYDQPDLVPGAGPYPSAEKIGVAALQGMAQSIPEAAALALAPEIGLPRALATATPLRAMPLAGGFGGAAGETTNELLPNSPWAPPLAGALAGMAVGGAGGFIGTPVPSATHAIGSFLGGGAAAGVGAHLLGIPGSDLFHEMLGELGGMAMPYVTRGLKGMAWPPGNLLLPAVGANAAANSLQPGGATP